MTQQQFVQFDKGKPFYDMVATFMVALSSCPAVFNAGNPMKYEPSQYISINGVLVPSKHLFPIEAYEQAQSGHTTMPFFLGHCCMMLANLAYESVKDLNDHSPEFEFFRHVRNAASHQNRFSFRDDEPRRPASWRGAVLDHTTKGSMNPKQSKECFGSTLGPADLIELLGDIEKKIAP